MMNFRHCVVFGALFRLIEGNTTLTTESRMEPTSARPTTLMRTIEVREADYKLKLTTDIFQRSEKYTRRRMQLFNALWKWDYWCMLQPETGSCGQNITKYYYNAQIDQCAPHVFSGCSKKNNKNQFDTIIDCENHCKGSALMPASLPEKTNICLLQPISGRCLGKNAMWYYDRNLQTCQTFDYGGCAGNENKFDREDQCLTQCTNKQVTDDEDK